MFQPVRIPAFLITFLATVSVATALADQPAVAPRLMPIGPAWAANSVNAAIFRNDPITTHGNTQYAAYYDADGRVVIATRSLDSTDWTPHVTELAGNIRDAHNVISIIADGDGYLHVSWDHHGHPLRYARSKSPGSLEFDVLNTMTGERESNVTYPQFFQLADGNLLFFFRDGASGRGNLVLNRYDTKSKTWSQLHSNLISGENQRNAYWQAAVDAKGSVHVSWVWRETWDVATNHDLCYARSDDGGVTWVKSDGTPYALPITATTAEIASEIPQKHELINQTSMCTDSDGRPVIATYFRPPGTSVVQYFIVRHDGSKWTTHQVSDRKTPFSLSGGGSKAIPISRPQVFARNVGEKTSIWIVYRDSERGNRVTIAGCDDLRSPTFFLRDLVDIDVRFWEPSYDHLRWQRDGVLSLYVQHVGQGDGERLEDVKPTPAYVLDWKPN